ncbi:MAG: hypothetical protein ABSF33_20365 [Acidimicrobiales bacterium]|jgi:hypothetical protein
MRYLWIGALVVVALFSSACSGSADNTPAFHFHFPKRTTTTTTTKGVLPTATTLASGPNDQLACESFAALGRDVGQSHRRVAEAFRTMFRDLKVAENPNLRRDGHAAARALILDRVAAFRSAFVAIFALCKEMS